MVLQKRLDYVFNRYQVPRATRSPRTRIPFRKKVDDNQMCAFDLLATVAGKLLSERENIPNSTGSLAGKQKCANGKYSVTKEQLAEDNPERVKLCDEGSCGNVFVPEVVSHAQNDACSRLASLETTSDCSDKFGSTAKLVNDEGKIEHGNSAAKVDMESYCKCLSFGSKLDDKNKNIKIEPAMIENEAISVRADILCFGDVKPPAHGSFPDSRDNVKLVSRDDDENSCGCIQSSTPNKATKPPPRIGDRRIRRLLTSKYWKVGPKLKDEERFSTGSETKYVYQSRVNCHKRQRSLRDYPIKKRRLYERSLMESVDGVDGTSGSAGKGSSGDDSREEIWASAFAAGQQTSFQPNNSQVKLKIKSFRVPELFIEIPETETVGSLKRIVMEAVTAMLSSGLGVGVLLQGKKIRDDNKTLAQIRISDNNKMDTLSFSLEPPNSSQVPPPSCPQDQSFLLPCVTPPSLTRCPQKGNSDVLTHLPLANFGNVSDHDSAASPPDISSVDKSVTDSLRAFVAVPDMNVEALAVVSMRKSKRLDVSQRRIRRPFSVSEVEALVQAVEKLGTGRWRDVKLRAFDNAKYRTYVDLKDKWKTLVHTARISPQQRRGEPVPQELLDRVLAAHAFWSQQQAKQQIKQHSASCLLL